MTDRNNKPHRFKKTTYSRLKLVISNPNPLQKAPASSRSTPSNTGFIIEVHKKNHYAYEINIQDPFHELGCDLVLKVKKSDSETGVICYFPAILNESHEFLAEDETLYGIIMIQFQMNVLEQLFLFCINHNASQLTIYMDDDQAEGFGVYQDFLVHLNEIMTENNHPDSPRNF